MKASYFLSILILLFAVNSHADEYNKKDLENFDTLNEFKQAVNQEQDNAPNTQFERGKMYYYGEGVPRDYAKAMNWFLKAAEQGNIDSKYWLGYMYHYGKGVPSDLTKAGNWYAQAAKHGDTRAKEVLYEMSDEGKREIAAQEKMKTLKIWLFLSMLCPLWGLLGCFFIPCSPIDIVRFIAASFAGGFLGFFIAFATNGGAAGSSEMSAVSWAFLLVYLVFYYPMLAKLLFFKNKKKPPSA